MKTNLAHHEQAIGLATGRELHVGEVFVHVPTPGDHYSPATGSAIMTIIHEMARHHAAAGGETRIIVSRGTRHDYEVGTCIEVEPAPLPAKWQKAVDAGLGRIGARRWFGERGFIRAAKGIERGFDGYIFLHNHPSAIPAFHRRHPEAKLCLWANNQLFRSYGRREARRIAEISHRLICCSDFIANDLRAKMGSSDKIRVVRNGADTNQFRPRNGPPPAGAPIILFLGRMIPEKGPDLLVRAALKLKSGRPFKLRMVGSSNFSASDPLTPFERQLRDLAAPLGDSIEFVPFVDRTRIAEEFQRATIFCVPSNWDDPCPLTVAEGMASGLAMVVSRKGGIPEVGGDAVMYFDPPETSGLSHQLTLLLESDELRSHYSRRARSSAEQAAWRSQYQNLLSALGAV